MTYISIREAANYLRVPVSVIYRQWRILGGVKIGRSIRLSYEGIDEAIKNQAEVNKHFIEHAFKEKRGDHLFTEYEKKEFLKHPEHHTKRFLRSLLNNEG